jgi:diguanylate cyclase (GGDEF)-like protein/PAS domain S-box-containing protein
MNSPYRKIVQVSRDYITLIDSDFRYVFVNDAYVRALNRKKEDIKGHTVKDVWGKVRFEKAIELPLKRCLEGEEVHFIDEFPFGEVVKYVEVRFFPYRESEDGPVTHALVISHDISRLGELETRLMAYEFRDPATGLLNRRSMDIVIGREIQKAEHTGDSVYKALFILSVDNFSEIRRQHGSDIATLVVENTGLRMKEKLSEGSSVFRSETDELAALIPDLEKPEDAASLAEMILMSVSTPYPRGLYEIRPVCLLGISIYPRDAENCETLISRSEAALSSAREQDVSYQFYDGELHARSVEKLRLVAQLRNSLYEDSLELYFQPIVDISGNIHGAESLLRWRHPEQGLLPPARFLHLAEETGLSREMEKWVIFTAARYLARWKAFGIYLSINLTAGMFEEPELIDILETALSQAGEIPKDRLKLEITESDGMSNAEVALKRMKELRSRGFSIYIDDFGTGESSLRYLKDLPASVLKIDKAFVDGIESDEEDRTFLGHIINIIKDRQRYVVVEGVETAGQAALLASLEADALQGHYFSEPLPAEEFEILLKKASPLPG